MLKHKGKVISIVKYRNRDVGYAEGYADGCKERNDIMFGIMDRSITELKEKDLDGLTLIGGYAFYGCKQLTSAKLPKTITALNGAAFQNCTALTTVELNETLKYISANAFQGCTALNEITIPASVKDLAGGSLKIGSSSNKATITFECATPPTISSTTFDFNTLEKIVVPLGAVEAYSTGTNWALVADNVPIEEVPV